MHFFKNMNWCIITFTWIVKYFDSLLVKKDSWHGHYLALYMYFTRNLHVFLQLFLVFLQCLLKLIINCPYKLHLYWLCLILLGGRGNIHKGNLNIKRLFWAFKTMSSCQGSTEKSALSYNSVHIACYKYINI